MDRKFQQRRAQAQWSDKAFAAPDRCPACQGSMSAEDNSETAILVCSSCSSRWRVELGHIYEIRTEEPARDAEATLDEWRVIVEPTVISIDSA